MKFKAITSMAYAQIKRLFAAADKGKDPGYWSRYLRYEPEACRVIAACGPIIRIEYADPANFCGLYEEGGVIYLEPDYFSGTITQEEVFVPFLRDEELAEKYGSFQYPKIDRIIDANLTLQESEMSFASVDLAVITRLGQSLPAVDRQIIMASRGVNRTINVYSAKTRKLLGIVAPLKIEDDQLSLFAGDEFKCAAHEDFETHLAKNGIDWDRSMPPAPDPQGELEV